MPRKRSGRGSSKDKKRKSTDRAVRRKTRAAVKAKGQASRRGRKTKRRSSKKATPRKDSHPAGPSRRSTTKEPDPTTASAEPTAISAHTPTSERAASDLWKQVFRDSWTRLRQNWKRALIAALIGAAAGWLVNVAIMAVRYEGFRVPSGSPTSGQGNIIRGSLFWFAASAVVSAVVNYRLMAGRERFWAEVRGFPETIRSMIYADGERALTHALAGFAGSVLFVFVLGPSLSGILALGVLLAVGTFLRPLVVGSLMAVWRWVMSRVAPRATQPPAQAITVALLGGISAMAVGFFVRGTTILLLLALAAGVAAVMLAKRQTIPSGPALLVLMGGSAALVLLGADVAFADDGGWRECGVSLQNWLGCSGADRVRWLALFGGVGAGAGSAVGAGVAGGSPDDSDSKVVDSGQFDQFLNEEGELDPQREAAFYHWQLKQDIQRWREQNPDGTVEDFRRYVDGQAAAVDDFSHDAIGYLELLAGVPGIWKVGWEVFEQTLKKGDELLEMLAARARQSKSLQERVATDLSDEPSAFVKQMWGEQELQRLAMDKTIPTHELPLPAQRLRELDGWSDEILESHNNPEKWFREQIEFWVGGKEGLPDGYPIDEVIAKWMQIYEAGLP